MSELYELRVRDKAENSADHSSGKEREKGV